MTASTALEPMRFAAGRTRRKAPTDPIACNHCHATHAGCDTRLLLRGGHCCTSCTHPSGKAARR